LKRRKFSQIHCCNYMQYAQLYVYIKHIGYRQQLKLAASNCRHRCRGQLLAHAEALPAAQRTPDPWMALEWAAVAFIPSAAEVQHMTQLLYACYTPVYMYSRAENGPGCSRAGPGLTIPMLLTGRVGPGRAPAIQTRPGSFPAGRVTYNRSRDAQDLKSFSVLHARNVIVFFFLHRVPSLNTASVAKQ
jgi:hypothetical protein